MARDRMAQAQRNYVQKQRIYFTRTYRHLAQSTLKNVLFFLLLILPSIILYLLNLHRITTFVSVKGIQVLSRVFVGLPMGIDSRTYPVFGTVDFIDMPTVYPTFSFVAANLGVILVVMLLLVTGKRKGHPTAIYLFLSLLTHVVSCVFFIFGEDFFPYDMRDFSELYISQQISLWLIFILLTGLITGFIGGKGYLYKCLTFFVTMLYSFCFGAIRYIVFLYVLHRFSILYMAVMFFVLGPLFDFLYLVGIYSIFVNKMTKYYDSNKRRGEWRWS